MCGIIGYIGNRSATGLLLEGLERMEYRGYDSAGVAVMNGSGVETRKAAGKISQLERALVTSPVDGDMGIGHTRWATHGVPNECNAHPHVDCKGDIAVVHNGIIENSGTLKQGLQARGHKFRSETDTEVIAHLIEEAFDGNLEDAVIEAPWQIEGTYGIAVVSSNDRNKIVAARKGSPLLLRLDNILITACGTSWHSALIGEHMLENLARIPVEVEYASELRYRNPIVTDRTLCIVISQSGETADTLAAMREAKARGARTYGIVNVLGSTIARETDGAIYVHAGPEIGVASTKAFTSQVVALLLFTLKLARLRNLSMVDGKQIIEEMQELPGKIQNILDRADEIEKIAEEFKSSQNFLYLGRGYSFPTALEGALKLKEISYIHAEGYPAAEMKHGPIALIDDNMPVLFITPHDSVFDKVVSNVQEVKARGGRVIAITTRDEDALDGKLDYEFRIPETKDMLTPVLASVPLQLLAYYIAVKRGTNVDQPRNLAKSVTVE